MSPQHNHCCCEMDMGRPEKRRDSSADQLSLVGTETGNGAPNPSFPRKRESRKGGVGEGQPSRLSADTDSHTAPASPISGGIDPVSSIREAEPAPSVIETQFPVSRLSKESYKERKANYSQTLTGLGKWWGRKPLILVRAVILGLLMPATDDPRKDLEVFLALLTMDEDGLWRRKHKSIPLKEVDGLLSPAERQQWFTDAADPNRPKLKPGLKAADRKRLQRIVFDRMSYDDKLNWCVRPEHLDGPSPDAWQRINEHLGTTAASLPELVKELGERRFGHTPRVGDAFCGGGSVPFEAARLGCEAYGSDLNPVAALLTWSALNIVGGGEKVAENVWQAQADVFRAVDQQITEWRIEHNEVGWRADAFLYCTETTCPECGWLVPLAPSWVIGEKTRAIAQLRPEPGQRRFAIDIRSGVNSDDLAAARNAGTVKQSRLECPNHEVGASTPMTAIRGEQRDGATPSKTGAGRGHGLRQWENDDLVPRPDDVFQERLYCVRWRLPSLDALLRAERAAPSSLPDKDAVGMALPDWLDLDRALTALIELLDADEQQEVAELRQRSWRDEDDARVRAITRSLPKTLYRSVDEADLERETHALALLQERFAEWQTLGYIPSRPITPGAKTDEPIRTRGWTHWHHLFAPRQVLSIGEFSRLATRFVDKKEVFVPLLQGVGKCVDWNSKLCKWTPAPASEKSEQTFLNQALNSLFTYGVRGLTAFENNYKIVISPHKTNRLSTAEACDARDVEKINDLWITDPPYADAINYHELSEFFLAWYEKRLPKLFPAWYTDSKRALAVQGADADFRRSMVDCYRNLVTHMPDDGLQVVMFTHQDTSVWADLTLILWAAGLHVTAAWTIATETESALKEGNYVQGTVLMVLRKQASAETAFLDELVPEVESEVERQLDSMLQLDDREAPNFSDADYQLAAYAAALRVLTRYGSIEDIDIAWQLSRERRAAEVNPIERIIEDAVKTASNFLVPRGLPDHLWRRLVPEEKLYLKGIEVESRGEFRSGVYQEFARGFGVRDYRVLLQTAKANETRLKTASEFGRRELRGSTFGNSLVRHALYAVWRAAESGEVANSLTWLRAELPDYWPQREALASVLRYLAAIEIEHWRKDAAAARIVAGAVENDHV